MNLALTVIAIVIWGWLAVIWMRRIKARREFERISITPEALHSLLEAHAERVNPGRSSTAGLVGRLGNHRGSTEDFSRGCDGKSGSYPDG